MMSYLGPCRARKFLPPSSRISTGIAEGNPPEKSDRSSATIFAYSAAGSTTVTEDAPFPAAIRMPSVPRRENWATAGRETIR